MSLPVLVICTGKTLPGAGIVWVCLKSSSSDISYHPTSRAEKRWFVLSSLWEKKVWVLFGQTAEDKIFFPLSLLASLL